jgi:hypothetical protein
VLIGYHFHLRLMVRAFMSVRRQMTPQFWLLLSLFAAATAWLYMNRVLGPSEHYINVEKGKLKAAMGDLYPRWVGTRALLLEGKNPYGPEVSHEIQMAFYGHALTQNYDQPAAQILDEQRFAYPVYVVFMLAPTALVAYETLQAWVLPVLIALVAITVLLWLGVLHWELPMMTRAALIVFILSSPQIAQGLRLRQLGFLVGCLLALATWCVLRNHLVAAGVALALSTIKPQMVVLPIAWFMIWGLAGLTGRWRLLAGFWGALGALVVAGEAILPGWIGDFLAGLPAYRKYVHAPPLLQVALGIKVGTAAAAIVVVGLLALAWKNRKQPADSLEFAVVLSAFLIGSTLALPLLPPFNQVLLMLPLFMIVRDWAVLPKSSRFAFVICVIWPWLAEIVLLVFPPQLKSVSYLPLLPSALVLLVPFLLPLLWMTRRRPSPAP